MSREDVLGRWPTVAAIELINSLLGVRKDQYSQDWEFEISDADRLDEYLHLYESKIENEDERFALMSVIIDAFEHSVLDLATWSRIREHLKAEFEVHQYTIHYWCLWGEEDLENAWAITPWMRELWNEERKTNRSYPTSTKVP